MNKHEEMNMKEDNTEMIKKNNNKSEVGNKRKIEREGNEG